ncbi:MAG: hypothetical protein IJO63_05230 [Bacilli bacterium]|nr:hypothetical protein [Bacilli bacterium]
MIIKCQKPEAEYLGRIARDYYLDNEAVNGRSSFRNLSLRCCEKGILDPYLLQVVDKNFSDTGIQVESVFGNYFTLFIGMYADNGELIAHTSMTSVVNNEGLEVAEISEIHIKDKGELMSGADQGKLSFVYGIYREMLEAIQTLIAERFPNTDRIDIITFGTDGDFWQITENLGYDLIDSGDLPGNKLRFAKKLKERDMTYERRNPNQQN